MARCWTPIFCVLLGLLPASGEAQTRLRVATWNIEDVGVSGSPEYTAAYDVLARIDADVVCLNEISGAADVANLQQLAVDAGYPHVAVTSGAPFGSDRNAVLSRYAFVGPAVEHTAAALSAANDLTRLVLEVVVDVPGDAVDLTLVAQHWKSGTGNDDEFRRSVESIRIGQALAALASTVDAYVIAGDVNEESDSVPRTPNPMTSLPSGLPGAFSLGADLAALLSGAGIPNDPFGPLQLAAGADAVIVEALQRDGSDATRPSSGRRLDYLLVSDALDAQGVDAEVYDSEDEGLAGTLVLAGSPLAASASLDASDHFPVVIDLTVPAQVAAVPTLGWLGASLLGLVVLVPGAWSARRSPRRAG